MAIPSAATAVVKTAAGSSINAGIWTLVGIIVSTAGLVAIAWIKQKGPWAQNASDERSADFERLRSEIREIRVEAKEARDIARRLEAANACMRPAISILMAEVRRLDPSPNNQALVEAQKLMEMAAGSDFGVGKAMVALANIKEPGE